jgi:serine/threonine protein kinase/Flp pilus assembly protein TadD
MIPAVPTERVLRAATEVNDPVMAEAAALAEELAASWRRGVPVPAEDVLAVHRAVAEHPRAALRIIYEEACQRQERGEEVPLTELQARFPQWRDELVIVEHCHRIFELAAPGPRFPDVGDVLGEFRLVAELGRGGMGRVYLAEQAFLAGRRMILKVTPLGTDEHLHLARLQHTHIVPLYAVRDFPDRHVRNLCMPCLGGATLQQILRTLAPTPPERRTGRDLLAALEHSVADPRLYWHSAGPNQRFLEHASYVQAVCWVGVCLADALHYAHQQELVHLDVKPSNVLLTADFQPMLLDFHLARRPIRAGARDVAWLGGTPVYMAPEQHAAWSALRHGEPIPQALDARTDVYALGLLLRKLLYDGHGATEQATTVVAVDIASAVPQPLTAPVLPARADISPGLRDLLARCLSPQPSARYVSAADVAEDLRCHLTNRPFVGVPNRSLAERWDKWRRRRPYALPVIALMALCLGAAALLAGVAGMREAEHRQAAQTALAQGRQQCEQRQFAAAVETFNRAREQHAGHLDAELQCWHARALRGQAIMALHRRVERSRYLHGDELLAPATLRDLEAQCRAAWLERERLLDAADAALDSDLEETLRRDLLDVAVLWADAHARLAKPADRAEARGAGLRILDEAETLFGCSAVLHRQRTALGQPPADPAPAPRTAWEHYALGRWLLRSGDLAGAADAFDCAVHLRPQDFWPWFGKGLCAHQQRRNAVAVTAFSVCVALAPDSAACYFNRALALAAHGEPGAALRDYDKALELDPRLASAALNRGVLHLQQHRFDAADADLQRALTLGADPAAVQYNRGLVEQARKSQLR